MAKRLGILMATLILMSPLLVGGQPAAAGPCNPQQQQC
jgi:hypothetical protein